MDIAIRRCRLFHPLAKHQALIHPNHSIRQSPHCFRQPPAQRRTSDMAKLPRPAHAPYLHPCRQRRFWEHRIRDEKDFNRYIEYIHYNPVKHGLVKRPVDWKYSSIHSYIRQGIVTPDWGAGYVIDISGTTRYE
jgi:REP element-mobilizing transposase RayT